MDVRKTSISQGFLKNVENSYSKHRNRITVYTTRNLSSTMPNFFICLYFYTTMKKILKRVSYLCLLILISSEEVLSLYKVSNGIFWSITFAFENDPLFPILLLVFLIIFLYAYVKKCKLDIFLLSYLWSETYPSGGSRGWTKGTGPP